MLISPELPSDRGRLFFVRAIASPFETLEPSTTLDMTT